MIANPLLDAFATAPDAFPEGQVTADDGTRLTWRDGRVAVAVPGREDVVEYDERTPVSVQLSRWRRQVRDDGLVERLHTVHELHLELRPRTGERVRVSAAVDEPEALNGLPWLERDPAPKIPFDQAAALCAGLAGAGATLTRWQTDDLGTAPELRTARDLSAFDALATACAGTLPLVGLIFLAISLPIALILGSMGDIGAFFFDPDTVVEGEVTDLERTGASENESPVIEYAFAYELDGTRFEGTSYLTADSGTFAIGDPVTVVLERDDTETARIDGTRGAPFSRWILLVGILPLVALPLAGFGLRSGWRKVAVLRFGRLTRGRLVDKSATNTRVNNQPVMALTFEFTDHRGEARRAVARAVDTRRLEDEALERILYLEDAPNRAVVVDELTGSLTIDDQGELVGKPNRLYAIPALIVGAEIVLALIVLFGSI